MSLLTKTICSFFPNEVKCTFVEEPWFLENYELQLDVLRLCQMGFACVLFTPIRDRYMFKMHVACCMERYVDPDYHLDSPDYRMKVIQYLTSSIPNGEYLLTRSWFCKDIKHQVNVYLIELNGMSSLINAIAGDFNEHIDSVMDAILFAYEVYGTYTRTQIVQGMCNAFFYRLKKMKAIVGIVYDENDTPIREIGFYPGIGHFYCDADADAAKAAMFADDTDTEYEEDVANTGYIATDEEIAEFVVKNPDFDIEKFRQEEAIYNMLFGHSFNRPE
jgi:hypothetical protein